MTEQKHIITNPFAILSKEVIELNWEKFITNKEMRTWEAIIFLRDVRSNTFYAGHKWLMEKTGYSRNTIGRHIKKFIEYGLLELTHPAFGQNATVYKFLDCEVKCRDEK